MARTILVPLDGSPFSERALPVALCVAGGSGATLHLVRIHVPATRAPISLEGMPVIDQDKDSLRWEAERAYVTRIRKQLGPRSEVATRIAVLNGPVAEVLTTYAAFNQVDLIVMTTHGRGGLARAWLGSVADALLRHSSVPVLLVRATEDTAIASLPEGPPRMLVALDGSRLAEEVLEPAVNLGRSLGAEYTLLRVINPLGVMGDLSLVFAPRMGRAVASQRETEAKTYLDGIARWFRDRGLEVKTKVIDSEQPAETILDEAERHGFGFIAMATHGRSGLSRLLMGSVASRVLHGTSVPLLLCRPRVGRHQSRAQTRAELATARS
jgi:nucleotide-binding universal stress UspA family protein